mmetsp:Transcript_11062/g.28427  ORF Transcript_11062/g.28427 Transcript_11062/m.28427 type:complete len:147 (-) Transcript_11062:52-492(-)
MAGRFSAAARLALAAAFLFLVFIVARPAAAQSAAASPVELIVPQLPTCLYAGISVQACLKSGLNDGTNRRRDRVWPLSSLTAENENVGDVEAFSLSVSLSPLAEGDSGSAVEDGTEDVLAQVFPNIDVQRIFNSFYTLVNGNALLG